MRRWFMLALGCLLAAAAMGVTLRLIYVMELSWLRYERWEHAHSHVAMLGWGYLLAIGVLAVGLLGVFVAILLWRAFCEFYVTIFKISEDLHVLRQDAERERAGR